MGRNNNGPEAGLKPGQKIRQRLIGIIMTEGQVAPSLNLRDCDRRSIGPVTRPGRSAILLDESISPRQTVSRTFNRPVTEIDHLLITTPEILERFGLDVVYAPTGRNEKGRRHVRLIARPEHADENGQLSQEQQAAFRQHCRRCRVFNGQNLDE